MDALTFGIQVADYSVGRISGSWVLNRATPNSNNLAGVVAPDSNVALNEWLTASGPGSADWIELFNRSSSAPVALQGLYLAASNSVQQIRSLSFVAPRSYVQLKADQDPGAGHIDIALPAEGGRITLYSDTAVMIESVAYAQQQVGVSEGKLPDGGASIQAFPGTASPGAANYVLTYSGPVLNEVLALNQQTAVSPWGIYSDWLRTSQPGRLQRQPRRHGSGRFLRLRRALGIPGRNQLRWSRWLSNRVV